jgi:hypothetical protein
VEVNESADSEAKQATKEAEAVNYCYQLQILKRSGKRKRKNFTIFVKTPSGTEEKAALKGTIRMARLRGSAR